MQAAHTINSIKLPYQALASDNNLTNNQSCAEIPSISGQPRSIVQVSNTNALSQASMHNSTSTAHEAISQTDTANSISLVDREVAVFSPFSISSENTEYLDFLFELLTWLDPKSRQAFKACSKTLYACIRERYPLSLVMRNHSETSLDAFLKTIQSYADKNSAHPNTIQNIPDSLELSDLHWIHDDVFDILVKNLKQKLDSLKHIILVDLEELGNAALYTLVQICTKLESITFYHYELTDEALKQLATIQTLKELNTYYCKKITNTGLEYFSNHPLLTKLDLMKCFNISDEGLKHLATIKTLNYIDLRYTHITATGLLYLKALPNVRTLNLSHCPNITQSDIDTLSRIFKENAIDCIIHH